MVWYPSIQGAAEVSADLRVEIPEWPHAPQMQYRNRRAVVPSAATGTCNSVSKYAAVVNDGATGLCGEMPEWPHAPQVQYRNRRAVVPPAATGTGNSVSKYAAVVNDGATGLCGEMPEWPKGAPC